MYSGALLQVIIRDKSLLVLKLLVGGKLWMVKNKNRLELLKS